MVKEFNALFVWELSLSKSHDIYITTIMSIFLLYERDESKTESLIKLILLEFLQNIKTFRVRFASDL